MKVNYVAVGGGYMEVQSPGMENVRKAKDNTAYEEVTNRLLGGEPYVDLVISQVIRCTASNRESTTTIPTLTNIDIFPGIAGVSSWLTFDFDSAGRVGRYHTRVTTEGGDLIAQGYNDAVQTIVLNEIECVPIKIEINYGDEQFEFNGEIQVNAA